jgi:hypothetical protein
MLHWQLCHSGREHVNDVMPQQQQQQQQQQTLL